jgi:hypothetical protein
MENGAETHWPTLAEMEREHILLTLEHFRGNRTHAARALSISLRGIRHKIIEYRAQGFTIPGDPHLEAVPDAQDSQEGARAMEGPLITREDALRFLNDPRLPHHTKLDLLAFITHPDFVE